MAAMMGVAMTIWSNFYMWVIPCQITSMVEIAPTQILITFCTHV